MLTYPRTRKTARRGVAMLMALIFLAVFACLAVAIAGSADSNITIARNRIESRQAASLAEAGLQIVQLNLGGITVPASHSAADVHWAIATHLRSGFASSAFLDASNITTDAGGVTLPTATASRTDGRAGRIDLHVASSGGALDDTTITIQSTGRFGLATRTATYNMTVQRGRSVLMDYGIASRSPIQMTGNASITGANEDKEGSILSDTYSTTQAIRLTGDITVSGKAAVCNPSGKIVKTGNVNIKGGEEIGAVEPEWPEVDISIFTPYAKNTYSGKGSGDLTLSNIRIPANTNPNFSGNVTISGVVYIESPNKVTFSGNANIVGVIVAQQPAVDNLKTNQISFTGNVSTSGVENLPAGAQYDGLRSLTGSFLLAPGYDVSFTGNFNTVSGCMVASQFAFTGNAGGRIKGGVINLRDSAFLLGGNAALVIDRKDFPEDPAGLSSSMKLVCVSGSYAD